MYVISYFVGLIYKFMQGDARQTAVINNSAPVFIDVFVRKHFDGSYEGPLVRQYTTSRNRVIPQHCIPSSRLTYIVHKSAFTFPDIFYFFFGIEKQCSLVIVSDLKHGLFVICQKIWAYFSCKLIEKDVLQKEIMRKMLVLIDCYKVFHFRNFAYCVNYFDCFLDLLLEHILVFVVDIL